MSSPDANKEFSRAKNIIFRLLKIRNRSEREIRDRLKLKNISKETIERTVLFCKTERLMDDRQFTQEWISARLAKPYGWRRIAYELVQKGIPPDLLNEELVSAKANYREDEIVFELAAQQAAKYKNIDQAKCKQRLFNYLANRGFSFDSIQNAIDKL